MCLIMFFCLFPSQKGTEKNEMHFFLLKEKFIVTSHYVATYRSHGIMVRASALKSFHFGGPGFKPHRCQNCRALKCSCFNFFCFGETGMVASVFQMGKAGEN